ncbi:MAG TPA: electron transfer flavoprotein subunit alpha/FixB family protein, partial [Anaerolineae bacterium]
MSILVYVDSEHGVAKAISWEIMAKARELAAQVGLPVVALVVSEKAGGLAREAITYGADRVLVAEGEAYGQYRTLVYAAAFKAAIAEAAAEIILLGNSAPVRDFAAMVACELGIGLAADCQEVALEDGNLKVMRPVFSGNILADMIFQGKPQMVTVRNRSFAPAAADAARQGEIVPLAVDLGAATEREQIVGFEPAQQTEMALENAAVIVSGGRGVKSEEGFAAIRELAKVLNAGIGASRAAVDAGWI